MGRAEEVRARSGIAIAPIDPKDFIKVLDAREGVERVLARDAARFGSPRDYERLEAAAKAMRQAVPTEDVSLFLDADKAFDIVLGAAASNPYAARIVAPCKAIAAGSGSAFAHHRASQARPMPTRP